ILQPVVGPASATREDPVSGRLQHFIGIVVLSVVLAIAELGITRMKTPGMWVMGWLCVRANPQGCQFGLGTIIILPIVLDASMILAVLWGAYSMWMEARGRNH